MQTKSDKRPSVLALRRPSPTEFAGFVTGGSIGAYTAGPLGAAAGMILGAVIASLAERAIDRSASRPTANGHHPGH